MSALFWPVLLGTWWFVFFHDTKAEVRCWLQIRRIRRAARQR